MKALASIQDELASSARESPRWSSRARRTTRLRRTQKAGRPRVRSAAGGSGIAERRDRARPRRGRRGVPGQESRTSAASNCSDRPPGPSRAESPSRPRTPSARRGASLETQNHRGWEALRGRRRSLRAGAAPGPASSRPSATSAFPPAPAASPSGLRRSRTEPVADEAKVCRSPFSGTVSSVEVEIGQPGRAQRAAHRSRSHEDGDRHHRPVAGKVAKINVGVGDRRPARARPDRIRMMPGNTPRSHSR